MLFRRLLVQDWHRRRLVVVVVSPSRRCCRLVVGFGFGVTGGGDGRWGDAYMRCVVLAFASKFRLLLYRMRAGFRWTRLAFLSDARLTFASRSWVGRIAVALCDICCSSGTACSFERCLPTSIAYCSFRSHHWNFDRASGHECSFDMQAQSSRERCSKFRHCEFQPASLFRMAPTVKKAIKFPKGMKAMKTMKARKSISRQNINTAMKNKRKIHGFGGKARTTMKANTAADAWDATTPKWQYSHKTWSTVGKDGWRLVALQHEIMMDKVMEVWGRPLS